MKGEQIISIELDLARDIKYRNPLELSSYVRNIVEGKREVRKDIGKGWYDDKGILNISLINFLLDKTVI